MKIKEYNSALINIKSNLLELFIYMKETTIERSLKSVHDTQKRNKFGHFRYVMKFPAYKSIYLGKLTSSKASVPNIYVENL